MPELPARQNEPAGHDRHEARPVPPVALLTVPRGQSTGSRVACSQYCPAGHGWLLVSGAALLVPSSGQYCAGRACIRGQQLRPRDAAHRARVAGRTGLARLAAARGVGAGRALHRVARPDRPGTVATQCCWYRPEAPGCCRCVQCRQPQCWYGWCAFQPHRAAAQRRCPPGSTHRLGILCTRRLWPERCWPSKCLPSTAPARRGCYRPGRSSRLGNHQTGPPGRPRTTGRPGTWCTRRRRPSGWCWASRCRAHGNSPGKRVRSGQ